MKQNNGPLVILGCLAASLYLFIAMPIWYYLLYKILEAVQATPFMWAMFWIYVPVGFIGAVIGSCVSDILKSSK